MSDSMNPSSRVNQDNEMGPRSRRAFVGDDTSKARAGRKVEGASCYFDHTEGRKRKGHQALQLGMAVERGFLPVEAQLVMGEVAAIGKPEDKPFKEIKRHLGFLKEQSGRYQVAYASVHLAAMRYLLPFEAMLRGGQLSCGEIRDRQSGRLQTLSFAALLWQLFRALIEGALDTLVRDMGRKIVRRVLNVIDQSVEEFLNDALHINPEQVAVQLKAEQLGYL